jgi:hypothetical protein
VIDRAFLDGVMLFELALLILSVGIFFSHGLWLFVTHRRVTQLREHARLSLARLVNRGTIDIQDMQVLRQLSRDVQVMIFLEISTNVSGAGKDRLRFLASDVSLLDGARALCHSRYWTRRLRGARLLARLDVADPLVETLLADPHPAVRAQAAEWAAAHPSPAVIATLLQMLADPATQARFAVQDALLRMGSVVAEPLEGFLERHSGSPAESGLRVAEALAGPGFMPAALRLSASEEVPVRVAATNLLGAIGGVAAAERLIAMLNDSQSPVRAAAAHGLGRMRYWQGAAQLADTMHDRTWRVRREAALALRSIGAPGVLFLRRALKGNDPFAADMAQLIMDLPEAAAAG